MLLDIAGEGDEIVIFYTKNSPHMAYSSVIKLLQNSSRTITFEECYEGNNALDFQLISYLGFLMAGENPEEAEFVIMSNDTGYDPAIRFWKKKGFSIKRFNINYCKMTVQRQKQAFAEPLSKAEAPAGGADDAVDAASKGIADAEKSADMESTADAESTTNAENIADAASIANVENTADAAGTVNAENTADAAGTVNAENTADAADTVDAESIANAESTADAVSQSSYPVAIMTPPAGKAPAPAGKATAEKAPAAEEAPAPSRSYNFNKEEVDAFLNCLGKDNLVLLHETFVHVYGMEQGQAIYKTIKEKSYTYKREENLTRKDKVMRFTDMIFARSNLDAPGNFLDFLEKNKDKTKNLNSIRAAITKTFGNGNGMKYYSLFKPYFKIISALK